MTEKRFFHAGEIPRLLDGDFPEFEKHNGVFDDDSELPNGLYPNTNKSNFLIYRGGYGSGHSISPTPELLFPEKIKH